MPSALRDGNVAIYAFSQDHRAPRAVELPHSPHPISVHTLNEFVNVARRKLRFSEDEIEDALTDIVSASAVIHPASPSTHLPGLRLSVHYRLKISDALIVAIALEAGCGTLFSKDLHHGLIVEDQLTIIYPFV